ncbi:MAG TPA: tetratricopeptide repeat protein [Deltaproteobacteria bacterium]|nr:tetratricopeptide repeat protein [Deltaproteobacteria bacterium]
MRSSRALLLCLLLVVPAACAVRKPVREVVEPPPKVELSEEDFARAAIEKWRRYMSLADDYDLSVETALRLTEHYFEARDILYKKEMEEYEAAVERYEKGEITEEPIAPVRDYGELIDRLAVLAGRNRFGRGADALRYALGYALYEDGRVDEAVEVFEGLIGDFPRTPYYVEVSFRLGEIYFETGQMGEAIESYERVLAHPDSVFYFKAIYKLAWVYYKLDEFENAADSFFTIMESFGEQGRERASTGLWEEGFSGAVMALSHFARIEKAVDYLRSRGVRAYTPGVLQSLGSTLHEAGRYEEALYVYNVFVELFPEDERTPFTYAVIAELYDELDKADRAMSTRWDLAQRYNPTTAWYGRLYPAGNAELDRLVAAAMLSSARAYHVKGRGADTVLLEKALKGYTTFLDAFPDSDKALDVRLLAAETLFDLERYEEAVVEYSRVLDLSAPGARRGEIAFSAILTYEVIFYRYKGGSTDNIRHAEEVLDRYGDDLSAVYRYEDSVYKVADMYSRLGLYARARERIQPLTRRGEPEKAYRRLAELYMEEGDLEGAEKSYGELVSLSGEREYRRRLAAVKFKIAERLIGEDSYDEASSKLMETFETDPGSEVGEAALLRLGNLHIRRKLMGELERVVAVYRRAYPDSEGPLSLLLEAAGAVEREEPVRAASIYEKASFMASDAAAAALVLRAGLLFESSGELLSAVRAFRRYLAVEAIEPEMEEEVRYRLGKAQMDSGAVEEGLATMRELVEWAGESRGYYVAKARLVLLREAMEGYFAVRLVEPVEENLVKKTRLLQSLMSELSQLIDFGIAELLPEIYYPVGLILEDYKVSLLESERPEGLTAEELEEYDFLLEEKAIPYDERAVAAYENGYRAGVEQALFNEWVVKSLERLAELRPATYRRSFDTGGAELVYVVPGPIMAESVL